ncbi:MAG: isoprenylcysteine carboxylmethyltransferase family protein [Nitrospirae bacterium]|nr:isoprenylcysteine carboxylmethyltransferase family protein [Nitrospirota bacterium]
MTDILALITIIVWPVVPLFWIPVHGFPKVFRRLGLFTYVTPLLMWLPLGYLIYTKRAFLLGYTLSLPLIMRAAGLLCLAAGTGLHIWTAKLLGLWGLMGLPEISLKIKGGLVTEGPFSVVRHPTYLAHTLMFTGVFLITEVAAVGVVTLFDLILINAIVIPLEDRELTQRFGTEYEEYKKKVPRYLPKL